MLCIVGVGSGDEGEPGGQCKHDWIDVGVNVGLGQGLCLQSQLESWRCLALSQPVNTVVMDDVCHVDVSSSCMDKVSNSNSEAVSVPSDRDNLQPWVGQLSTLSVGQDPTMKRVYSRYVGEMDDLTGTTYPREESYFVYVDGKFGESH